MISTDRLVAPYISQQKKNLAETPAYEEEEVKFPSLVKHSGGSVRIPADLMPSDAQCMQYFEIFFAHVHPYVPVISKPYFYQQWNTNRNSISPLILEAIFACAGRMSDDADEGASWLSMARGKPIQPVDQVQLSKMMRRARRVFYGRAKAQHSSSTLDPAESSRVAAQTWILLPIMDDGQKACHHGV